MNIIERVQSDLACNDWDLYTKARYLYLKSCEYFTYDHRYYYSSDDIVLSRELFSKKINLEKVHDNRVICSTWATQVYIPLLDLIGVDGKLFGAETGHQYVKFLIDGIEMKADACGNSDLARIKFGNSTSGFHPNTQHYDNEKIMMMDREIGYLKDEYFKSFIDREIIGLEDEFKQSIRFSNLSYNDEYLIYKFYKMKEMLETFPKLKDFSDCQHFITYVSNKLCDNYDESKVKRLDLYNPDSSDWNFSRLYQLELSSDIMYFILTNPGNGYHFYQITNNDVENYKASYQKSQIRKYL